MIKNESMWRKLIMMRTSYLLISFLAINYLFSNQIYNLNNYLKDHPAFPMSFITTVFPYIFPIIFLLPAIIYKELASKGTNPFKNYIKDGRVLVVLGQITFSACFLGILWYLMVNTPGYTYNTIVDKRQISDAFIGYSLAQLIVLGLLGSDELKDLVKEKLGIE